MSETPEEQPSTGVLGRIGSWFSPWKGKSPKSLSGSESPSSDQELSSEGVDEDIRKEEESEGAWVGGQRWDATQSAHSAVRREGGSKSEKEEQEEFGLRQTKKKNASHLTQGDAQAQVHTGKKTLHVYLEETSGQEVVRTKVTGTLRARPNVKASSLRVDFESKATDVKSDPQSCHDALAGASLKSHIEVEPDREQTDVDSMGRRNAARRKHKKAGDSSPQPPSCVPPSDNSVTPPEGKSPQAHTATEESTPDSALNSQASPTGGESETSGSSREAKLLDAFQIDSNSVAALDGDMEDDDSLYRVERKTETPESKRRSIKVSRSEVKMFPKYVPFSLSGEKENHSQGFKSTKAEEEKTKKTEIDGRLPNQKKPDDETKRAAGKLADKIGLFERQGFVEAHKKTFQAPRSADVSPVRKVTDRLKMEYDLPAQRSKSAERQTTAKSRFAEEKPMSVKDRIRNLTEASTSMPTLKPPMTGMPKKPVSSAAGAPSGSEELDGQGKLDAKEQIKTKTTSGTTLKPDRRDTTAVPKQQPAADTATASKTGTKLSLTKSDVAAKREEVTGNLSPPSRGPSRTGSRSKRRKSREPSSPVSPNSPKSPSQPEVSAINQEQEDDTAATTSASKQPTSKVKITSLSSDKTTGVKSEKQADTVKQNDFKKDKERSENHKDGTDMVISVTRREELPEAPVSRDEPDTAPGTKKPIDEDSANSTQNEEEKAGTESSVLPQESQKASADQSIEKTPTEKHESPVETPQIDKEASVQPEEPIPQNKDTEFEEKGSEKTNQAERKDAEKPQELPRLDENTTNSSVSEVERGLAGTEASVAKPDEANTSGQKQESAFVTHSEQAPQPKKENIGTSVDLPGQTQHISETAEIATIPGVTLANEAAKGRKSDEGTPKVEVEVVPQSKTKPVEICGGETGPAAVTAAPQSNFVSVEKSAENSLHDSQAHGANGVECSESESITGGAVSLENVSKATNDSLPLKNVQEEKTPFSHISAAKSASDKAVVQENCGEKCSTIKTVPSEDKLSRGVKELTPSSLSSTTEKTSPQGSSDRNAESTLSPPPKELPPLPIGDNSSHTKTVTVKKEPVIGNTTQSPKTPASPESSQRPPLKKLHLPRALLSKDDFSKQDAPSSWLDVDFPKQKLKVLEPRLTSAGSESNLLDTSGELDDNDFVEKIKHLCAPFSLPPRKHNHLRHPQPPFAMPAIKEARFEKTFDPEEFQFGLRKKKKFTLDTSPSILANLQATDTKAGLKPARASLADRSLLLSSLDTESRLKDITSSQDEVDVKEEKEERVRVKSRLEGSCVLSSLTSSSFRSMRNGGVQSQTEATTNSGEVSPSTTPQHSPPPSSPSQTSPTQIKDTPALSAKEEVQPVGAVVSDSGPSLPSFSDIKLPDYLEKYLHREPAKPVQSTQEQEKVNTKASENMTAPVAVGEANVAVKPAPVFPEAAPPCFPVMPPNTAATQAEQQTVTLPLGPPADHVRTPKGFHRRPGKMVLFEKAEFTGQVYEVCRDVADATTMQFSPVISVKVIRGCWVLYEKPEFQGRCIALEEGGLELANMWAEADMEMEPQEPQEPREPQEPPPMQIGSIRHAVWDYSLPHIDLFTEPEGHGRVSPYQDDVVETGSFGIPLSTASIQVHSGVWLVFSDPGFQGMLAVLETGVYPFPQAWGFPAPFVGSLRPLKMGAFKVENPNEVRAVLYEKPGFEGASLETDGEVFSFGDGGDDTNADAAPMKSVGSLKVFGGLWVGYSLPGFEGQQHILEEGEYLDCSEWGSPDQLLSIRPILAEYLSPHLKMFTDVNFGGLGTHIDLVVPVINLDEGGYGLKTQSVDVTSGVWVAFEEPGFCGESYILEKGLYGSPEDWGALQPRVGSVMPVTLDDFESAAEFKVQLFSDPDFQGAVLSLEDRVSSLQDSFTVGSCKVVAGSWQAFEGQDFSGRMYVLEVGSYPDLRAMGCDGTSSPITSLQPVGFEFSLPSVTLFERSSLRGKRVVLTDGSVNLQLAGGCGRVQSLLVEGGMWVVYEGINYLGEQILLKPGEIPDWRGCSGWNKIGSLRPLTQKQVHFRMRNRHTGLVMSVTGDLDDVKMLRIQETEETGGFEQIWFYQNGYLHCKLLEECCLSPTGSVAMSGSRVGLAPRQDQHIHLWSVTPEGFICYGPSANLVLDVKGGLHYDKNQIILNTLDRHKAHQRWDVEIL